MRAFKDDRNRAYNDVFPEIGVGDINISRLYPGTIKAFHRHKNQDDYWFVIKGNLRAVLVSGKPLIYCSDNIGDYHIEGDSIVTEHYLSEGDILYIPRGVWHGLQVLGNEEAIMIYHITNKYNPKEPDEERAPWDAFHSWQFSRK